MILSKNNLHKIIGANVSKPHDALFTLPVKVLQFGTGVLLRGLNDYLIDKANRLGVFNGRVLVIKSTSNGDTSSFKRQNNLYTVLVRGFDKGNKVEENIISAVISDVVSANEEWDKVLAQAANPELSVILSNTTEVGIQLLEEDIHLSPPASFPAKLLAVLYKRFESFNGSANSGLVIVPTELLPDNGTILKDIVLKLSRFNELGIGFESWLNNYNFFCNSLVDRIVPGKPSLQEQLAMEQHLDYEDDLMIVAEAYHLWAIEGNETIKDILSFEKVSENLVITPDIQHFRELKMRLLNGAHTVSCALAILADFDTVKTAMDNQYFAQFVTNAMSEISTALPDNISLAEAARFSQSVCDRFRNPYIQHLWTSISQQFSAKMKMRVLPVILKYYEKANKAPRHITIGFAAYLVFMRCDKMGHQFYGEYKGMTYTINDDQAAYFCNKWHSVGQTNIAEEVLSDTDFWGADLRALPGFADTVQKDVDVILAGDLIKILTAYKCDI